MIQAHKIFSSHLLDSLTYLSDTKVQGQVKLTKSTGPSLYVRQVNNSLSGRNMNFHILPHSILHENTSKAQCVRKSSNICHIKINDGPASRVLALTTSKLCNNASLEVFALASLSFPQETSTRWQKWQLQEKKLKLSWKQQLF